MTLFAEILWLEGLRPSRDPSTVGHLRTKPLVPEMIQSEL